MSSDSPDRRSASSRPESSGPPPSPGDVGSPEMGGSSPHRARGPSPPVWFLLAILLQAAAHLVVPIFRWQGVWSLTCGLIVLALGIVLVLWADGLFTRFHTTVKPLEPAATLVTCGVYRLSRNPMYLGLTLVLWGLGFLYGSLTPLIPPMLFWLLMRQRFVLPEEVQLRQIFGESYLAYCARVRRWL